MINGGVGRPSETSPRSGGRRLLTRRTFLFGAATAAAVTGICGRTSRPGADDGRPNVLLVVTDDQPLGTEWATPALRELVGGQGVTFTRAYATTPLCAPSRASILSGRYAHNHGVLQNERPQRLDQGTVLPRYLREAGYRTALFGKYLNGWNVHQAPPHFDEYALMQPPKYGSAMWNVNGTVSSQSAYSTSLIRDHAVEFLRRQRRSERPWFLYVSPYAPHKPFTPEQGYAGLAVPEWNGNPAVAETDKRDKPEYVQQADTTLGEGREIRAGQLRTLRSVDDLFRALRAELLAQGQLDDTLIIVISDNGYCWADHGWGAKSVPYGPAVRIPLYMSWPAGGIAGGGVDDRLVANIDIAPTILDAVDVRHGGPLSGRGGLLDGGLDGRSLLRPQVRDRLLLEWWRAGPHQARHSWAATVTADYQYVEYYDTVLHGGVLTGTGAILYREYYDLRRDPYQLTNLLHDATPAVMDQLDTTFLSARLAADRKSGHGGGAPWRTAQGVVSRNVRR
ncbi:Arylsulfatase A [Thermomonospora echinospora]|uniref:Arylsulfatase A n=1 Tax=Thermomonospora echinospora TaxID=1992 RepID=A0A1H6CSM3_9ACTN|nr:sulfatase [Thermomonospora echinospora]SEG75615.1 Arylsulfatase A [Thermomonospora echinospora]